VGAVQYRVDEEAPVGGDVVLPTQPTLSIVYAAADDACRKEHNWCARFEGGPGDGDWCRHHRTRAVEVVQLLAVGPPGGMDATRRGHPRLARSRSRARARRAGRDERPLVDFRPPRFVRLVGDPIRRWVSRRETWVEA